MLHASRLPVLLTAAALLLATVPPPAGAADGPPGMAWVDTLPQAFEVAKAAGKPVMICINATKVAKQRWRPEPAAKELRENTYRHPDVIKLSEQFVCAYVSSAGTAEDFGELRARFAIDGDINSPQHIFAYPDGRLLYRKEFWPYGTGQQAVDALLKMMNDALGKHHARAQTTPAPHDGEPPEEGEAPDGEAMPEGEAPDAPPEDPEGRAQWIAAQLRLVGGADEIMRRDALRALVDADRDGDVVTQVLALLGAYKKKAPVLADIVRELGRPGLEAAVKPLCGLLTHKEVTVRAHAAVSLEYIGSKEAIKSLSSRAGREKDQATANHMYRALGRCGAGESKVRSTLVKAVKGADSNFASYGPIIGLAYFEKDEKTARQVEKLIKAVAMPSGRGAWRGAGKRGLLGWCLSEVGFGDRKAAKFVNEEVIPAIGENRWARAIREFYVAVRDACNGDEEAKAAIEAGARRGVSGGGAGGRFGGSGSGDPSLTDEARRHREHVGFTPKGEFGPIGG